MTVRELKEYLADKDDDKEIVVSKTDIYTDNGWTEPPTFVEFDNQIRIS